MSARFHGGGTTVDEEGVAQRHVFFFLRSAAIEEDQIVLAVARGAAILGIVLEIGRRQIA